MKVGSLVECIGIAEYNRGYKPKIPVVGLIYVVRGLCQDDFGNVGIYVEEIINPPHQFDNGLLEPAFNISIFKELQPPLDLTELLKETEQLTVKV